MSATLRSPTPWLAIVLCTSACGDRDMPTAATKPVATRATAAAPTTAPLATPVEPKAEMPAGAHAVLGAGDSTPGSLFDLELELEDQRGAQVSLGSLRGTPFIIAMFYSKCSYACPTLIRDVQRIEAQLTPEERAAVRVVLVSFDPAADDPKALADLAERHIVDGARWTLARARDDEATRELAGALGIKYRRLPDGHYNHSTLITFVDATGVPLARIDGLAQDSTAFRAVIAATLGGR